MKIISRKYKVSHRAGITLIALSLFLAIPAIIGLFADSSVKRAKLEKREMATLPSHKLLYTDITGYFSGLDNYINDHFGLSIFLNSLNKKIQYYVFHDSPAENVTHGHDGYIFLNSHNKKNLNSAFKNLCLDQGNANDYINVKQVWSEILLNINKRGYKTILAVVPSKPVLYAEKLPGSTPKQFRDACLGYKDKGNLLSRLVTDSFNQEWSVYYPFEAFYNQRNDNNFYPKESFHWHGHSTHIFTTGLLSKLNIETTEKYSSHKFEAKAKADMVSLLGFNRSVQVQDYNYSDYGVSTEVRKPELVKSYYKRASDFRESFTRSPITNKKLLIISNSFGVELVRHISPAYKHVVHVNINHISEEESYDFFTDFIDTIAPDDIAFVFHDAAAPRAGKRIHNNFLKNLKNN